MNLQEKLMEDLQQAMRAKDVRRCSTLRLLRAAVTNKEIEAKRPLTDQEVLGIISKEAKQRRETIEEYSKGGRQDLVEQEQAELAILKEYMPRQLGQDEIEALVREAIAELGVRGLSQIGAVMRHLMPRLKGRADESLVNQVVREVLAQD